MDGMEVEAARLGQHVPDERTGARIAIVHDWLYVLGGAEKVLRSILRCFPCADVFSLFDILPPSARETIGYCASHTSFLQRMPGIARHHRLYLPLMPLAIEQLDLSGYDIVISSSHAVAKGVLTGPDQLHVSYVHSPMRYAWDLQHQYLRESGMEHGPASWLARLLLHRLRLWDVRTAHAVDDYVANSHFIARRIAKLYGRRARVVYPPCDIPDVFTPQEKQDFFLTASRLVPYKNVHRIVEAFATLPDCRLVVAGSGPEMARLRAMATANVRFTGFVETETLHRLMATARAFVFAAEEDFGIAPVEAQAWGTPVIALDRGGVRETVCGDGPDRTGLYFDQPTAAAIGGAVRTFLAQQDRFRPEICHRNAQRFSETRFCTEFTDLVLARYAAFTCGHADDDPPSAHATVVAPAAAFAGRNPMVDAEHREKEASW